MTIAVVIPTLNEERAIASTLAHSAWLGFDELIVADGGSIDRTANLVRFSMALTAPEPPRDVYINPLAVYTRPILVTAPPGRASQMNTGAHFSRSDVLVFLHADTMLPPDARRSIEEVLHDPDCVGGRFDVRFNPETVLGRVISRLMNLRSRLNGIATGDQAIFVRRSTFETLGGFAEIPIMEDIDFSRRLKRLGTVRPIPSQVTTSYRRWQCRGPVRTIVLMWLLRFLYWIGVSPTRLSHLYTTVR